MTNGYNFYFKDGDDVLTLPITPDKLVIRVGSNNKVITLIGEGDINILKSPSLIEVEFEARFPMRQYPYGREFMSFETYFNKFTELKENKKSFRFIVTRAKPNGDRTWDTNLLVALEDFDLTEDADEGDDVIISFKLRQFKEYGIKRILSDSDETTSTSAVTRANENKTVSDSTQHVIKSGDTLYAIAKSYYDDGSKWKTIYNANQAAIEADAKKHGRSTSGGGRYIWPGLTLIIPTL